MIKDSYREKKLSRLHSTRMLCGSGVFVVGKSIKLSVWLWLFIAFLGLTSFSGSMAQAGCHDFSDDWYRSYHHGFNGLERSLSATSQSMTPQVQWTYEDGEFRAIDRPLPPLCQGPQCRNTPSENLGTMAPVEYQRTFSSAIRSSEIAFVIVDLQSHERFFQPTGDRLAGFPTLLDEPPR
jgi:hypothetical protein